jgi:hypothetical protein
MLVGPYGGGVDAEGPFDVPDGVVLDNDLVKDPFPGAVRGPFPQPLVGGLPGPVSLGQVSPWGAGPQLPQDRVDHLPVIAPLPTPTTHRQQRPNPSPRHIGQLTTSHHQRMINERWSNDSQDTP